MVQNAIASYGNIWDAIFLYGHVSADGVVTMKRNRVVYSFAAPLAYPFSTLTLTLQSFDFGALGVYEIFQLRWTNLGHPPTFDIRVMPTGGTFGRYLQVHENGWEKGWDYYNNEEVPAPQFYVGPARWFDYPQPYPPL